VCLIEKPWLDRLTRPGLTNPCRVSYCGPSRYKRSLRTHAEVRDQVLDYIPLAQLGTTDDRGFWPFCDDTSTTRDPAIK
jgi:hypothetical protein